MRKVVGKSRQSKRGRATTSIPCPSCGGPTEVLRTSLGERRRSERPRNFVLRERRCLTPHEHRFFSEEHIREEEYVN